MRVLILLSLLFPLAAGPLARAVSARVEPVRATWLMTGAALLLAGTSCGALGLLVLSPLVRMPWLARLGHWSSSIVSSAGLPGGWTSLVAAIGLGAALLAAIAFAVRRGRALADASRHARSLPGRGELVVTRDAAADAYAVPGRPGRIVVSVGMLGALDDQGRAALLAHERAHLTGRHHWFTAVARLSAAANPLVRPLASAVEYSVERWADESAASAVGDRQLVARAIANAALAAKATKAVTAGTASTAIAGALGVTGSDGAAGCAGGCARVSGRRRAAKSALGWFAGNDAESDGRLAGAGPVPRRVAALLTAAPTARRGLPTLAASLLYLGAVAVCALVAADHLQDLLSLAHATAEHGLG
jgi:Zn-dependent protease with chaperone function